MAFLPLFHSLLKETKTTFLSLPPAFISWFSSTVDIGYCDYRLATRISDIVTIFPIPKANFSTVAVLPCDYLLVHLLDIATILPSSQGSHYIR